MAGHMAGRNDNNKERHTMQDTHYAGFWARVAATIIDTMLLLIIAVPLLVAIYGWAYFEPTKTDVVAGLADFLISWVMPTVAVIAFWAKKQATPGKMVFSARIVDAESGEPAGLAQLIGRYLAYIPATLPLGLGILWVAFDRRKQGWHDKLAGTVVVRN
jgi:uncharacterized RDD family membrane protein YckC